MLFNAYVISFFSYINILTFVNMINRLYYIDKNRYENDSYLK